MDYSEKSENARKNPFRNERIYVGLRSTDKFLIELAIDPDGFDPDEDDEREDDEVDDPELFYHAIFHESTMEKEESKNGCRSTWTDERETSDGRFLTLSIGLEVAIFSHQHISEDTEECLHRDKKHGNHKKGTLVYWTSEYGMEGVFISDEGDPEEREKGDHDPDTWGGFESPPFFEGGF